MRRKDLKRGMKVDIVSSSYRYVEGAIVLDVEPWTFGADRRWRGAYRLATLTHDDKGQVPVAILHRGEWRPRLVRLNEIKPPGTVAHIEAKSRQEQEERRRAMEKQDALRKELAERLGVNYVYVDRTGQVTLDSTLVFKLLDEAGW